MTEIRGLSPNSRDVSEVRGLKFVAKIYLNKESYFEFRIATSNVLQIITCPNSSGGSANNLT
ncbi:MAG: hypothetical protein A3H23_06085 [Planctomycetes bacterium RIFCSPLOWO2_12_FULL_40_19]|nr:MAG: hypothetical protein A3H23_06085 [Planctomycetes bacterium RIFCSPLOWO2_12_FULL_40_19]